MLKLNIKLNDIMKKNHLNIQQVSDKTRIHRDIISKYKKGYVDRIDVTVLERLGYGLNCNVSDLIEFQEQPQKAS